MQSTDTNSIRNENDQNDNKIDILLNEIDLYEMQEKEHNFETSKLSEDHEITRRSEKEVSISTPPRSKHCFGSSKVS